MRYSHRNGVIFDGDHSILTAEVAKRLNDAPRWMDRPDRPGLWVLPGQYAERVRYLSQEMIDKGIPLYSSRVYGPIPEDVQ